MVIVLPCGKPYRFGYVGRLLLEEYSTSADYFSLFFFKIKKCDFLLCCFNSIFIYIFTLSIHKKLALTLSKIFYRQLELKI